MKLNGGIDEYSYPMKRYLSDESPKGRKVQYRQSGGWDYDIEYANEYFSKGEILTVEEIYVGRSSSKVEFEGLEHKQFNTVMFEDVE